MSQNFKKTKSDIGAQSSQQQIDDFLLSDEPFKKLYNRLGENDDFIRNIFDVAFDFSDKKNYCAAMEIGEYMFCGKPCEDMFCDKHNMMIFIHRTIPGPCLACGIGVMSHTQLCWQCDKEKSPPAETKVDKPERKFDMLTFDDELCFGLRD